MNKEIEKLEYDLKKINKKLKSIEESEIVPLKKYSIYINLYKLKNKTKRNIEKARKIII